MPAELRKLKLKDSTFFFSVQNAQFWFLLKLSAKNPPMVTRVEDFKHRGILCDVYFSFGQGSFCLVAFFANCKSATSRRNLVCDNVWFCKKNMTKTMRTGNFFWLFSIFVWSILEFLNSFLWTSPTQQGLSPVQIYTSFYSVMLGTSRPGKSKQ